METDRPVTVQHRHGSSGRLVAGRGGVLIYKCLWSATKNQPLETQGHNIAMICSATCATSHNTHTLQGAVRKHCAGLSVPASSRHRWVLRLASPSAAYLPGAHDGAEAAAGRPPAARRKSPRVTVTATTPLERANTMTKQRTFRDYELAEQHDAAKRRRAQRRLGYYDGGAQSMLGTLDEQGIHAQAQDPADRAFRIASGMLSGRGQ